MVTAALPHRKTIFDKSRVLNLGDSMPFADAAKEIGTSTKNFTSIYRNYGGTRRGGISRRKTPTKIELVGVMKLLTNREAARHFGVGYKTLVRWLKVHKMHEYIFSNDMLSLAHAARLLKVSRMTLSNWYRKGEIPGAVKVNETRVLVPRATIRMLLLLHKSDPAISD